MARRIMLLAKIIGTAITAWLFYELITSERENAYGIENEDWYKNVVQHLSWN